MSIEGSYKKLAAANLKRIERYVKWIESLLSKATGRFISLSAPLDYDKSSGQFYFDDFPEVKKAVEETVSKLARGMEQTIITGTSAEWTQGTEDANGILDYVMQQVGLKSTKDLSPAVVGKYLNNHEAALQAFQKRSIGGMSLSEKVWNLANQNKIEAELARSIAEGTSADEVASSMKEFLNDSSNLFRRVRDEFGTLRLSKRAKAFNPGAGSYRSSFKNAQRLARTEINMAYRNAEQESYQEKDYVVGIEIKRSNNPYDCPLCESLAGKYPKNFKWSGWHPNCRCYMVPILISDEEMDKWSDAIINGEEFDPTTSENYVGDVPENFTGWVAVNSDRIREAEQRGTLPYFIRDNEAYVVKNMAPQSLIPYEGESTIPHVETDIEKAERLSKEQYREIYDEAENRALAAMQAIDSKEEGSIYEHDFGKGYVKTGNAMIINSRLRRGATILGEDLDTVKALDSVIAKNTIKENCFLYRMNESSAAEFFFGIDKTNKMLDCLKNGQQFDFSQLKGVVLQDKAFSSASLTTQRNYFVSFLERTFCFEIKTPKGTNAFVTNNFIESEVVLGRNQRMMVMGGRKGMVKTGYGMLLEKIIIECVII